MNSISSRKKWMKYQAIAAVVLINFTSGTSVFFVNIFPYIESYFRYCLPPDRKDLETEWLLSSGLIFSPVGMLLTRPLISRFGLRFAATAGAFLYCVGSFASYFTVATSAWATSITFGVIATFGTGVFQVTTFCFTSAWFPSNQGLAGSAVVASGSAGAILINFVVTAYVNPDNLKPDVTEREMTYFSQAELLERVPVVFVILGSTSVITQVIGCLLMTPPDSDLSETKECLDGDISENGHTKYNSSGLSDRSLEKTTMSGINNYDDKTTDFKGKDCKATKFTGDEEQPPLRDTSGIDNNDYTTTNCMRNDCVPRQFIDDEEHERKSPSDNKEALSKTPGHFSPRQMVKSRAFFALCLAIMIHSIAVMVVSSYSKSFAQYWIPDDMFLTFVGSATAVTCTLVRTVMGYLMDRLPMKDFLTDLKMLMSLCLSFWYFTPMLNRWSYFVMTNVISGLTNSIFVVYPMATLKIFGLAHFPSNCGIVMMAVAVTNFGSAPLVAWIATSFGWFWLFFTVAALVAASGFAIVILMPRTQVHQN